MKTVIVLKLDKFECGEINGALIDKRNSYIKKGESTTEIDSIIHKVLNALTKEKEKRNAGRQ